MEKVKKLLLLNIYLLLLTACGQGKQGITNTEINLFSGAAIAGFPGGTFVYGIESTQGKFVGFKIENESDQFAIENGSWSFYALSWNGANTFEGTIKCGIAQAQLGGGNSNVNIDLSTTACANTKFGSTSHLVSNQFITLSLNTCNDLSTITVGSQSCSASSGIGQSFKVFLPEITPSSVSSPSYNASNALTSECQTPVSSSRVDTALKIPVGSSQLPVVVGVRSFENANCTGGARTFFFTQGLQVTSNPLAGKMLLDAGGPATSIYIKHLPDSYTQLTATQASIKTATGLSFSLSNFVTGGVTPLSYSVQSGLGGVNATTGVFTSPGSANSTVIRITDFIGDYVDITVDNYDPIAEYDLIPSVPGTVTYTNASANRSYQNNSGQINQVGANISRHEFDSSATALGLLIEGGSTNIEINSENLTGWTQQGSISVTADSTIAPDTTTTAELVDDNVAIANTRMLKNYPGGGLTATSDYVFSIFLKAGTSNIVHVHFEDVVSSCNDIIIDLSNGSTTNGPFCGGGQVKGVIPFGNGWYRVWLKENFSGSSSLNAIIYPAHNSTLTSTKDNNATGTIYAWGAQVEQTSFPTSYIKTTGSQTGINADDASSNTGVTLPSTGTYYVQWHMPHATLGDTRKLFYHGNGSDFHAMEKTSTDTIRIEVTSTASGNIVNQTLTGTINPLAVNKAAYSFDGTTFLGALNGGTASSGVVGGTLPTGADTLYIGKHYLSNEYLNAHIREVKLWDQKLDPYIINLMTQ